MDLNLLEGIITRLGVPVAFCVIFGWIAIRAYLVWEKKISVQLDKQEDDVGNMKHCSTRTVEILEMVTDKLDRHILECHDFHQEIRHKLINGGEE